MSIFDFYNKSVNELYLYKTTCPICNVIEVFYINEKIIEHECNHCSSTYEVKDEEIVRVMDRSAYGKIMD